MTGYLGKRPAITAPGTNAGQDCPAMGIFNFPCVTRIRMLGYKKGVPFVAVRTDHINRGMARLHTNSIGLRPRAPSDSRERPCGCVAPSRYDADNVEIGVGVE